MKAPPDRTTVYLGMVITLTLLTALLVWQTGPTTAERDAETNPTQRSAFTGLYEELAADVPPLSGSWRLSLPEDHSAHPEAPSETWALVAHLTDDIGERLSLNLTVSRIGLSVSAPDPEAPWTPNAAWIAQASVTGDDPLSEERFSRGAGAAGYDIDDAQVWVDDWTLDHDLVDGISEFTLSARIGGAPLELRLTPLKPAVAPGEESDGPTRGFAMTRLDVTGRLGGPQSEIELSGVAWLDRLWGDVPTPGGPLVYDRLVVHLDDGSEVSVLRTRRRDGRGGVTLDGVLVGADGTAEAIADGATLSESANPHGWRLTAGTLDLSASALPGSGERAFAAPLVHTSVRVEGTRDGLAVTGTGTLLLSPEAGQ